MEQMLNTATLLAVVRVVVTSQRGQVVPATQERVNHFQRKLKLYKYVKIMQTI